MTSKLIKGLSGFLAAFLLGTLYAGFLGLFTYPLRASLISWPIWIILFWLMIAKFNLLRISIYLGLIPLSLLTFEIIRTAKQPPIYAFQLLSLDRSHYTPSTRVINRKPPSIDSGTTASTISETLIGADGFRADP